MPLVKRQRRSQARVGGLTPFLLVSLMSLLACMAIAVNYIFLWQTRVELQNADDAASLGGIRSLVNEDLLKGNPTLIYQRITDAQYHAQQFSALNFVQGQPAQLGTNIYNVPNGNIVVGYLAHPHAPLFVPVQDLTNVTNPPMQLNAMRIYSPRTQANGNPIAVPLGAMLLVPSVDMLAASTAMLDPYVIGFRFVNAQPLPLASIAILSDPTGINPLSWEYNVVEQNGTDVFSFNQYTNTWSSGPDGLYEIVVTIGVPGGNAPNTNSAIVSINTNSGTEIANQITNGVMPGDLQSFGGQLVLGANKQLLLPGSTTGPVPGSPDFVALQTSLSLLQSTGAQRIWPLSTGIDPTSGETIITGWVAARVAQVLVDPHSGALMFTLQPTMLASPHAVTHYDPAGVNGVNVPNPYIVKIRLVQ